MDDRPASADATRDAALLELARRLRDAAVRTGRPDVAAKAGEAMALVGGDDDRAGGDGGNAVIRFLDGLGL